MEITIKLLAFIPGYAIPHRKYLGLDAVKAGDSRGSADQLVNAAWQALRAGDSASCLERMEAVKRDHGAVVLHFSKQFEYLDGLVQKAFATVVPCLEELSAVADQLGLKTKELACFPPLQWSCAPTFNTLIHELGSNILRCADEGFIVLRKIAEGGKQGVEITAIDKGKGICREEISFDAPHLGESGFGFHRLAVASDIFELTAVPDGNRIRLVKWFTREQPPRILRLDEDERSLNIRIAPEEPRPAKPR